MFTTFRIENKTIFKILASIVIFIGLMNAATLVKTQLIWIATAFFLAIALNPAVEIVRKVMPKRSRGASVFTVILAMLSLVFFLIVSFLPVLIEQSTALVESVPGAVRELQQDDTPLGRLVDRYNLEDTIQNMLNDVVKGLAGATGSVLSIAQGIFSGFAAALTIITLAIFMLLEGPRWRELLWRYHPSKRLKENRELASQMYNAVSSYFSGVLLIAALSAVIATLVMVIVGIPYAIPLGLVVGLFGLIPFVGATLAAVVVVIVALFTSTTAAIVMAVYFIIYQQLENNVIQPVIQGRSTELSPLVVTIAILIGVSIAGLFGALVAIPVAACIKVLIVHWLKSDGRIQTAKAVDAATSAKKA
jgi:predicted PurR-regulated permease PerM